MNTFSNMIVEQYNNNYRIFTPQKVCVAYIIMPLDAQYLKDVKALEMICKILANR
ncbi:hypothetical protein DSECCO2_231070 [anaerobic digester metagenome]